MRHIIATLLIFCCTTLALAHQGNSPATEATPPTGEVFNKHLAARGYRGFVNYTPLTFTFINQGIAGNISTTHGYQFSHNFFLGGGIAYYAYPFSSCGETDVPLYIAIQSNVGEKLAQFTYGGRLGMILYSKHDYMNQETYLNEIDEGFGGLYFNFNIGLRLGFTPQYAMTIKPQFDLILGRFPCLNLGIGFGFEF